MVPKNVVIQYDSYMISYILYIVDLIGWVFQFFSFCKGNYSNYSFAGVVRFFEKNMFGA